MYFGPGRAAGLLPTHDGQVMAFVQCRWADRHAFRADALANYVAAVGSGLGGETDLTPALARYHELRTANSGQVNTLNHRLAELPDDLVETERRLIELLIAEASADAQMASLDP
jgi:hypothetical protein